ncbi:MAG: DUF3793 family protein [Lachnospiraceae bacterium]|nr:DUF3793 family protein [Lachnospiraceae bacterium]
MIKESLIEYGAPTLAGIKTGNAFSVHNSKKGITEEIKAINNVLTKRGLRLVPIKQTEKFTLVYLYRPARLKKDLSSPGAVSILSKKGYCCSDPDRCLAQLVEHLKKDKVFPHEIGLFLGYPPDDVRSFMESPCQGVKCVGCWKAYSNQEEAEKTFKRFQKCTEIYKKEAGKGKSLEDLIVVEPVNER